MVANAPTGPDADVGDGTYTIQSDGPIYAEYIYDGFADDFSVQGDLQQTSSEARIDGTWYFQLGAESSNEGGVHDHAAVMSPASRR